MRLVVKIGWIRLICPVERVCVWSGKVGFGQVGLGWVGSGFVGLSCFGLECVLSGYVGACLFH